MFCSQVCDDNARRIGSILDAALLLKPDDHERALRDLSTMDDIRSALNILQAIVKYRLKAPHYRKLMLSLAMRSHQLPDALFLEGIQVELHEVYSSGSFGDVYQAYYQGRPVALKRLRVFQKTMEFEKRPLRKV